VYPDAGDWINPRPSQIWVDAWKRYANDVPTLAEDQPRFVPLVSIITEESRPVASGFVAVWRAVRGLWIERVFNTRKPPSFATRDGWRTFVLSVISAPGAESDEQFAVRVNFSKYLGLDRVFSLDNGHGGAPGLSITGITAEMVCETVSELADLNFFFDLFEVEHELDRLESDEIQRRMERVMRGGQLTSPVFIHRSSPNDRGLWLIALYEFMQDWPGAEAQQSHVNVERPVEDPWVIRSLESTVADLYCYNVTHALGRLPVLPRY
jgi:hypothetical protein